MFWTGFSRDTSASFAKLVNWKPQNNYPVLLQNQSISPFMALKFGNGHQPNKHSCECNIEPCSWFCTFSLPWKDRQAFKWSFYSSVLTRCINSSCKFQRLHLSTSKEVSGQWLLRENLVLSIMFCLFESMGTVSNSNQMWHVLICVVYNGWHKLEICWNVLGVPEGS